MPFIFLLFGLAKRYNMAIYFEILMGGGINLKLLWGINLKLPMGN
jgi:hypothetical protein